jgi:hypothetical protein
MTSAVEMVNGHIFRGTDSGKIAVFRGDRGIHHGGHRGALREAIKLVVRAVPLASRRGTAEAAVAT